MTITVTGATGHYGRLVVEALLDRHVAPADVVATGRDVDRIKDLADRGVTVRRADFADPDGLVDAFRGTEKLLLVSTTTPAGRLDNHRRAIEAARAAGVELIAYTSTLHADTARMTLADAHRATETLLHAGGTPAVVLRNGWYLENYLDQLPVILDHATIVGSAGDGRFTPATRADYAEAAAAVLTTPGHAGRTYELGGDAVVTLADLAGMIADSAGRPVGYTDLPPATYRDVLAGAGLPADVADALADADLGLARGELLTDTADLARLLGRPTTPLAAAVAAAVRALG